MYRPRVPEDEVSRLRLDLEDLVPLLGPPLHILLRVGVVVALAGILLGLDSSCSSKELLLAKMGAGNHNEAAIFGPALRASNETLGKLKLESGTSVGVYRVSKVISAREGTLYAPDWPGLLV